MFRITHNSASQRRVLSMNRSLVALDRVERQLSSGRRFERPGEAPESTARVLRIGRKQGDIQTYNQNIEAGRGMLTRAESAVSALSGVVNAARSLALKMADSFYDGERTAQTDLVNGLISSATDLLNTTYDDIHVFGGHQSSTPPYEIDVNGAMVYNGDSGQMQLDLSDGGRGFVTVNPQDNFNGNGGGENVLQLLIDLRDQMQIDSQAGVGATLDRFEVAVSQLSRTSAEIGTHYQQIDVHDGINEVQDVELERLRSTIEDTNYAQAATDMTMRQTAYQASLAATARVQSLSLLSYMR